MNHNKMASKFINYYKTDSDFVDLTKNWFKSLEQGVKFKTQSLFEEINNKYTDCFQQDGYYGPSLLETFLGKIIKNYKSSADCCCCNSCKIFRIYEKAAEAIIDRSQNKIE